MHLTDNQIATAFIHLLDPALSELGSPCLSPAWSEYVRVLFYLVIRVPQCQRPSLAICSCLRDALPFLDIHRRACFIPMGNSKTLSA